MSRRATWSNGKETVTGYWRYNWASDTFTIQLDSNDPVTGRPRIFRTHNDTPEWGDWKRVEENKGIPS